MTDFNKNMMLSVAGGSLSSNVKVRSSDDWLERYALRKPDRVTIYAGADKYSDLDRKVISKIFEDKKTVFIEAPVDVINKDKLIAEQTSNITKLTAVASHFSDFGVGEFIDKFKSSEMRLAIKAPASKDMVGVTPAFLSANGARADEKAAVHEALLCGCAGMNASDIVAVRDNAESLYALSAISRINMGYSEIPLCAVPYSIFEHINISEPQIIIGEREKKNKKCPSCVMKSICEFYLNGRVGAENIEAIAPLTQFQNIPRNFRKYYSSVAKNVLVDRKRKLSIFGPCNNRCVDCPDQIYSKPSIAPRDALRLVTRAWTDGADQVVITDGEPTIRKDFIPLIKAVEWYGMKTIVETNGRLLMVDKFLDLLKERTSCELVVRLAGHDSPTHDRATQTESFENVVAGVRKAAGRGLNVTLAVRLRPEIVDGLHILVDLAHDLGVDIIIDVPPHWIYFPDALTYSSLMERITATINNCESGAEDYISIQGIPLCLMGQKQKMFRPAKGGEFAKPPVCCECSFSEWCCGLPESYSLSFGTSELRPEIFNSESQICFPSRSDLNDFDIEDCAIKSGDRQTTPPGYSIMVKNGAEYALYQADDDGASPLEVIAAKNARSGAGIYIDGVEKKLYLCDECVSCRKLHECAACFEERPDSEISRKWNIEYEPRTLLVNRELNNYYPPELKYDEHITFRDFWQRMSRGGAGMPAYRTIIIHDSVDYFPSAERAMKDIAHLAPRGCDVIITGRKYGVVAGKKRGGDSVPAVRPHSISSAASDTRLVLKDYILNSEGGTSYWALKFKKEAEPAPKPHREKLASFFIIKTCVANCLMCNVQNYFKNLRMPLKKTLEGIDELRINGFEYVDLFGGEVTLREDLEFIVEYAAASGLKPMVITTGHNLDEEKAKKIRDAGAVRITVSLDGADEYVHEKIKNAKGLFPKAVAAAKSAARVPGIDVNINTVILPENYTNIKDIVSLVASIGASVSRYFLCVSSPATSTVERKLSVEQLHELLERRLPAAKVIAENYGMEIDFRPQLPGSSHIDEWIKRIADGIYNPVYETAAGLCVAPGVRALVDLDGAVYPCEAPLLFDSEHCIGNLNEETLVRILNSDRMDAFRKKAGRTIECAMCFGAMPQDAG